MPLFTAERNPNLNLSGLSVPQNGPDCLPPVPVQVEGAPNNGTAAKLNTSQNNPSVSPRERGFCPGDLAKLVDSADKSGLVTFVLSQKVIG